jgi:hypothetical protein
MGFVLRSYAFGKKTLGVDEICTFQGSRDGIKDQLGSTRNILNSLILLSFPSTLRTGAEHGGLHQNGAKERYRRNEVRLSKTILRSAFAILMDFPAMLVYMFFPGTPNFQMRKV